MLCITVLYQMPLQLRPFYLLERGYFWHVYLSPCGEPLNGHLSSVNVADMRVIRSEISVIPSLDTEALKRSLCLTALRGRRCSLHASILCMPLFHVGKPTGKRVACCI